MLWAEYTGESGKRILDKRDFTKVIYCSSMKKHLAVILSVLALIVSAASIWITEYEYQKATEYTATYAAVIQRELLQEIIESNKTILDLQKRMLENYQMLCSAGIKEACKK